MDIHTSNGSDNGELLAQIAILKAKLAKAQAPRKLTLKVSQKGAISIYGFGKWPVTLYKEQAARLLDSAQEIRDFIEANDEVLKSKGDE